MKKPLRIVILTGDDRVFALPLWYHTIPVLKEQFQIVGVIVVPEKLGPYRGRAIQLWYLRTFGIVETTLLFFYVIKTRVINFFRRISGWKHLGKIFRVPIFFCDDPNSEKTVNLVRRLHAEVMIIMVGNILKKSLLQSVSLGVINKHAALLPSCRGLFPYLWATNYDVPLGISFHVVNTDIDAGKLLVQKRLSGRFRSMLQFYQEVFSYFPKMAVQAVDHLRKKQHLRPEHRYSQSYFGLPQAGDVALFRIKGGRMISLMDFLSL